MFFENLHKESKIWTYTADRELTESEANFLQNESNTFVKEWAAHGAGLKAEALVYKKRFLVLAVDESDVNASGCSIDSSVKFVKAVGNELKVDFFNRMNLMITDSSEELKSIHISDLKNHLTYKVYNPMITTLKDLRIKWLIPVKESPFI